MKNMIDILLHHPGIKAFGLAILHSLWQGALIAAALFIVLQFVKSNANLRYLLACGALLCLLLTFGYTFYLSYTPPVQAAHGSTPAFTVSNHSISQVFIPQSAAMDEEKAFSFTDAQAAVVGWIERNSHYIFLLWLMGFLIFSSRLCLGLYYAYQLKRNGQQLNDVWLQKLDKYRRTLGIKSKVQLLTSGHVHTPLTLGWIKPVILLPVSMFTQLSVEHLESILLHELAHIKRQDYLVNLLQSVVETLLFFNPAYWYIARVIERERENACDDIAVGIIQQPVHYARALTQVAELSKTYGVLTKTTVAANRGSLTDRIRRIVLGSAGQTIHRREKAKWYLLSITVLAVFAAILFTQEVKGFQSEKEVEKEIETDLDVEVETEEEVDIDEEIDLDIEEEVEIDLDIEEEVDIDLDIEIEDSLDLDLDVQGASLDSTSLYHFLFSQWEAIKKRRKAMGEEVPDNVLLSDKTLYIVDGVARDPKTIKPPFDYTISIPHTVMWAATLLYDLFDIEDSYAAFRKKYPGDYSIVVFLTSKALKDKIDPNEPFTVTGQVFDGKTKTSIAGTKVSLKETSTSTIADDAGNFSLRVPNAEAKLMFSHEEKGYAAYERSVEWYRNKKMYVRLRSSDWLKKIKPEVEIKVHEDDSNPQRSGVSFKETLNSSDTGMVKGTASAIVLEIDENREDLPLYLVDGIEVSPAGVKKLDPQSLGTIEVIKKQIAVKRYGEKGKNGVVLVRTKKALREDRVQLSSLSNSGEPLYIVDGKRYNDQEFSLATLSPNDIASIDVLKGEDAVKIYGEDAAHGVIIIHTRSKNKNSDQENASDEKASGQEYFDLLKSWFDYFTEPGQSNLTEKVGIKNLPLPNAYDGKRSLINSVVDGNVQNWWLVKPHEVATVEVYQSTDTLSYFYNVEKEYGKVTIGGNEQLEVFRKKYPGKYDVLLIITTKKGKNALKEMKSNETSDNLTVFPNPSENIFTIQLTLAEDTPVQVNVIDAAGRLVTSLTDRSVGKGSLELKWDASGQKPGLYRIRIIQNGETTYRNVLVK